jgi:hypothetical protein
MGDAKKAWKKTKSAVRDVGKTVGKAAKDTADFGSMAATGGAYSTDGKSGWAQGNTYGSAMAKATGVQDGMELASSAMRSVGPKPPSAPKMKDLTEEETTPDPYLEEELANARRRARASNVLGGLNDVGGGSSARRSLMGA